MPTAATTRAAFDPGAWCDTGVRQASATLNADASATHGPRQNMVAGNPNTCLEVEEGRLFKGF